jgi:hypothetical protein
MERVVGWRLRVALLSGALFVIVFMLFVKTAATLS